MAVTVGANIHVLILTPAAFIALGRQLTGSEPTVWMELVG
jgi:hypothetical protein